MIMAGWSTGVAIAVWPRNSLCQKRLKIERLSAELPRPFTTEGVPEGDDPDIADIGYYAPSNDLVLYYGDVGYWNGIIRIGRFNADDVGFISGQPDGFPVTIEHS
jgi:hypothetical protein